MDQKVQTLFCVSAVSPPTNVQSQSVSFSGQECDVWSLELVCLRMLSGPLRVGVQARHREEWAGRLIPSWTQCSSTSLSRQWNQWLGAWPWTWCGGQQDLVQVLAKQELLGCHPASREWLTIGSLTIKHCAWSWLPCRECGKWGAERHPGQGEKLQHPQVAKGASDGKESACNAEDLDLIPGSGRCPVGGNGNPSSILAWRISWIVEPGGLQSLGSQKVRHDWATNTQGTNSHGSLMTTHHLQRGSQGREYAGERIFGVQTCHLPSPLLTN